MTLYYWRSNALAHKSPGWLIGAAQDPEAARMWVSHNAGWFWRQMHPWTDLTDEADHAAMNEFFAAIDKDLEPAPRTEGSVLFIPGSLTRTRKPKAASKTRAKAKRK